MNALGSYIACFEAISTLNCHHFWQWWSYLLQSSSTLYRCHGNVFFFFLLHQVKVSVMIHVSCLPGSSRPFGVLLKNGPTCFFHFCYLLQVFSVFIQPTDHPRHQHHFGMHAPKNSYWMQIQHLESTAELLSPLFLTKFTETGHYLPRNCASVDCPIAFLAGVSFFSLIPL